jgi:hypothetical protein
MAVPRSLCPEPWKSRPSVLRFDAIGKGAFSPCVRGYTNPGSDLVKLFLAHGVHINFPAVEQIDYTPALFIIASGQPPRFVHGTLDPLREPVVRKANSRAPCRIPFLLKKNELAILRVPLCPLW